MRTQQLAPLLLIEAPGTNAMPGWPAANSSPQIFFQAGSVTLNGKPHAQMTYWWKYPKTANRDRARLPAQGVRITLDSAERPVIWEVLADTSGAAMIFVAQSLEAQAVREFGAPLPGRRFAIERSLTEAADVVVARVIEDGPVVMGPILYLHSDTHDATTVICRCMDSQARELAGQMEYQLAPTPNTSRHDFNLKGIEQRLRLPRDF